jgi:hypothetical protein
VGVALLTILWLEVAASRRPDRRGLDDPVIAVFVQGTALSAAGDLQTAIKERSLVIMEAYSASAAS